MSSQANELIQKPAEVMKQIRAKQADLRKLHSLHKLAVQVHGLPPDPAAAKAAGVAEKPPAG